MKINASNFSRNRKRLSLTQLRVNKILTCVINSYEKIISDGVVYNYSEKGSIKEEDYLRNRLVDDYLEYELNNIEDNTNRFAVNKEVGEEYIGLTDNKPHNDPIDIHIMDYALKDAWGQKTKPYFAIECKRLVTSVSSYVNDTEKATKRKYRKLRLPFEGQLGFIENNKWSSNIVAELINKNLISNSNIKTTRNLEKYILKKDFDGSYFSEHEKVNDTSFSVFHLFFDYSDIVVK
ncbi:hypothetical protein SAMN04489761_1158 [Tenacibaculum sp. MAR_2009_124]|uniref:hypothetical protein n=1 Tax=Tenacibaculum sp. MAR_2009_124 TaxID=1250059 RepID=UPI000895F239|nr:hypothetical protein [Tenacibaculum sp. MAR_2009_124]SEB51583.1 hypothetical protein SAMN04489761_1158 [Tenacibaculum sp. MAR_2009_124]